MLVYQGLIWDMMSRIGELVLTNRRGIEEVLLRLLVRYLKVVKLVGCLQDECYVRSFVMIISSIRDTNRRTYAADA